MNTKLIGSAGEEIACAYLKKQGYRIIERNYSCSHGELDIVAQKGQVVSFVEVKTRQSDDFGLGSDAVTLSKQKRIIFVARIYIAQNKLKDFQYTFDVIEVYPDEINHIISAFTL